MASITFSPRARPQGGVASEAQQNSSRHHEEDRYNFVNGGDNAPDAFCDFRDWRNLVDGLSDITNCPPDVTYKATQEVVQFRFRIYYQGVFKTDALRRSLCCRNPHRSWVRPLCRDQAGCTNHIGYSRALGEHLASV